MHFGLYLKKKGIISAEQLVDAIEEQLNTLVPIGQLALEEGVLSARDIFEVLQAQNDSPHERFGELAVEMRLMTRDDLMRLLMIQADRKRPIADILVEQGILDERQAASELAAFRRAVSRPQRTVSPAKAFNAARRQVRAEMSSNELITV
jgi:hypothetical protein